MPGTEGKMSEELEVLKVVAERLNEAGIDYMISGSTAVNYYTVPRMTRDVDVVIDLQARGIQKFVSLFDADFYIDEITVAREVSRRGIFNIIHSQYLIKVDFVVRKESEFEGQAFARRVRVVIEKRPLWFISAEDLVIAKLLWAKESHSEMQLKDCGNLLKTVKNLDLAYIREWVARLNLNQVFEECKR